jgi:DNA-binding LacI/PurR family transcriptional regulator
VLGYQVDALIIASLTPGNEIIDVSYRGGKPVVLFNRYVTDTNASVVCCDNCEGGRIVADYFLDNDFRQIAYIAGPENTSTNIMREKGFTQQLQKREYTDIIREQAEYSYQAGREAIHNLLAHNRTPDAVFCAADIIALGVMDAARYELGLNIPQDLAVVGFDDIPLAQWSSYNLTTIRQPIEKMVSFTLNLTERADEITKNPESRLFPVELIKRGSA